MEWLRAFYLRISEKDDSTIWLTIVGIHSILYHIIQKIMTYMFCVSRYIYRRYGKMRIEP